MKPLAPVGRRLARFAIKDVDCIRNCCDIPNMNQTNLEKTIEIAKQRSGVNHIHQTGFDAFTISTEKSTGPHVATYEDGKLIQATWNLAEMVRNS
jgi:hypothetical protein